MTDDRRTVWAEAASLLSVAPSDRVVGSREGGLERGSESTGCEVREVIDDSTCVCVSVSERECVCVW